MDRALKERLAGAVVLVVLAVWLIPQVLDGPDSGGGSATQTLTLPAPPEDSSMRTQTIRLDDKRPIPSAKSSHSDPPAATPVAKPTTSKPSPPRPKAAVAKPVNTAPQPDNPSWFVQLGSFAEQANASRLADSVAELGFKTDVSPYKAGATVLHRVRVGPRPSRVAAEALASDLARRGYPGQVVSDG